MMRLLTNAWHQLVCDGGLKRFQGNSLLSDIRMIHGVNESLSGKNKGLVLMTTTALTVNGEEAYDEELEEEDIEEDPNSWTAKDWDHMSKAGAKALHHDGVMDVDKWGDEMKRMKERWEQPQKGAWKIKAPWASKPSSSKPKAWIRKHDQWGGECWSTGWYKDSSGRWWPSLSNRFSG